MTLFEKLQLIRDKIKNLPADEVLEIYNSVNIENHDHYAKLEKEFTTCPMCGIKIGKLQVVDVNYKNYKFKSFEYVCEDCNIEWLSPTQEQFYNHQLLKEMTEKLEDN